jgi:hypothetical protein
MASFRITASMTTIAPSPSVGPAARLVIRPLIDRRRRVDVTDVVISAIAAHLGRLFGGNDVLNMLEAERALQEALSDLESRDPVF